VAGVGAGLSQRSDGSFGRMCSRSPFQPSPARSMRSATWEAFTIEQHVASKLTDTGEISPGCALPIGKTPIAFALTIGEGGVNTVEPPLGKLHSFDDCQRSPRLSSITIRFPTSVEGPSLNAEEVAVFVPASTSAASSSASSGLSPNEKLSSPRQSVTASSKCDDARFRRLGLFGSDTCDGHWRSDFSTARKSIDQGSAERHHC
jgi:hypothetical protein